MRSLLTLILASFASFLTGLPAASVSAQPAASPAGRQEAPLWLETLHDAHQLALREQRLILVHFWSTSCGPCLQLEQSVFPRSDVRQVIGSDFASVKIDVAQERDLARHFQIRSIPTDIIFTPEGVELHRQVSPQDASQYVGMLQQVAARARPATPSAPAVGVGVASPSPTSPSPTSQLGAGTQHSAVPQGGPSSRPVRIPSDQPQLAMEGFCPVTLVDEIRWQPGAPEGSVLHAERWYRFASPEHRQRFLQNPERYVPAFSGYDIVQFRELGRMVAGKRDHGVVFGERYYLFADEEGLRRFWQAPDHYAESTPAAYRAQSTPGAFRR
jgi:thioredoxin-related protein/YHS domain-containing protein